MKTIKGILGYTLLLMFLGTIVSAGDYPEVSCGGLPSANSCSQCFNAGAVYEGWSRLGIYDDFVNTTTNTYVYYDKENPNPYTWEKLQSTTNWSLSSPLFHYVNNSKRSKFWFEAKNGDKYHIFDPNFTDKYLQADSDAGLQLNKVNTGTQKDQPAFVLKVHTNYRQFLGAGQLGDLQKHTECFYYYPNWCGDGAVQSDREEQCDPKDPNKTGWATGSGKTCNATCKLEDAPVYDLALTKTIQTPKASYALGDTLTFVFTVTNQGNKEARTIELTDYLPAGLELKDASWTNNGGKLTKTVAGPIAAGATATTTMTVQIQSNFTGTKILNKAEISKDNSGDYNLVDVDSTPDATDNDCFVEGKHLITGNGKAGGACSDTTDEDDHDGVAISIDQPAPLCASTYNGQTHYQASATPAWLNATMLLCNPGQVANFVGPDAKGNYTWTCNGAVGTTAVNCSAQQLRCGDAAVQTNHGEQCDPNDPNKTGWADGSGKSCTATCKLEDAPKYDLALTKTIQTPKAKYALGDELTFAFTVTNQGNKEARNIELTDYLPAGLELKDTSWTNNGGKLTKTIAGPIAPGVSVTTTMTVQIQSNFVGTRILNKAEISRDNSRDYNLTDIDSTPDTTDNNDCFVEEMHLITGNGKAGGVCSDATDEDDHDGVAISIDQPTPVYDLALTKTIQTPKASYALGDTLTFLFTVTNQGNKEARNIELTDYLPAGLELKDASWTNNGGKLTKTIAGPIAAGANATTTMTVQIQSNFTGTKILNKAEISKDNSGDYNLVDVDSTPDATDNDCFVEGKHLITGNGKAGGACSDTTDEDDHDGVAIVIDAKPEIKKDLVQASGHIYKIGELVGFKMPFKNSTANTLQKVSVKDFLPRNLEYVSSEIHGVNPIVSGQYLSGGITVVEYSGFNLAPNQEGYLLFTGRVKAEALNERINTVGIYVNDIIVNYDTETYRVDHPNLMIEKTVDQKVVASGDVVTFTLKVSVLSGSYDTLNVIDTLPKGLVYQDGSSILTGLLAKTEIGSLTPSTNASGLATLTWKLNFPETIKAGQSFQIQFKAKLTEASSGKYTNTVCVEDPKTAPHTPICDTEDVTPKDPRGDLSIKKYVNKTLAETGREDLLMTGFTKGQTGFFTLEVSDARAELTGFTISDTIEGNLEYLDSTDLLNNAFTGVYLRSAANTASYAYTTTLTVTPLAGNKTKLDWKVVMTNGAFLSGDVYRVQFKAKVNGDQQNVALLTYTTPNTPDGRDDDDAKVQTSDVNLTIKKYVSDKLDGVYQDNSITLTNSATAYFKLVISGATNSLTGFRVTDKLDNTKLRYLTGSQALANNAFTGVITFGANNPNKPDYTITPTVTTGATHTDILWQVNMGTGYFMPGDSLTIIFMAQKLNSENNIAHVYYPKRDGTEGHAQDPASVANPSGGGSTPPGGSVGGGGGYYNPSCGNGRKDGNEICDRAGARVMIGPDGKLFRDTNEYNTGYAGYTCNANCRLEKGDTKVAPQCFNLQNGSISIMKGEMLPFYWNMESQLGAKTQAEKTAYLRKNFVYSCADTTESKIALDTMQCYFKVYGPGKDNSNEIYSIKAPCVSLNAWLDNNNYLYPRIESYIEQNREGWFGGSELSQQGLTKNVFDSLDNWDYPTLIPLSSKLLITDFGNPSASLYRGASASFNRRVSNITTFGEYKVALERIDYQVCQGKDDKGNIKTEQKTTDERICEVDFAVTAPYLIQKSPYGIGNKATTELSKYLLKNGTDFVKSFFPTAQMNASAYTAPSNMKSLFTTFKNKYQKLAKPVNGNLDLLKVPGKAIYFYGGNQELTSILGNEVITTPFTLIATKGQDLTIKGSLKTNAMIMTAGKIIIDAKHACNGKASTYARAGQVLQGIFYAGSGFKSSGHEGLKNTQENLYNGKRCNYGNLHIRGVAIGDLSEVVRARRSELYEWFNADAAQGTQKKTDMIVNGASVLVEYAPSLRGNLPPGAEEFNKALEVYRK